MLRIPFRFAGLSLLAVPLAISAQAPAAARQLGTVTAVDASAVTLKTAAGAEIKVTVAAGAPVLQLPPGSTDLKAATSAKLEDVSVGDRILAIGKPGDTPAILNASRIILMKSTDISARNAADQREWQRHGLGGLVRSVDGPVITVASGTKSLKVETTGTTIFKRYAGDSVDFSDAKPGSLTDIQIGDQLRARGTLSDDRMSVTADQVISGSFENLSGAIARVDTAAQTITLKDLTTKKTITVAITQKSDLRKLTPEAGAAFAARNGGTGAARTGGGSAAAPAPAAGADAPAGGARRAGMDLSQMLTRLPTQTLGDLKPGDAVMIVASGNGTNPTAITLLSGVQQILSATPAGGQQITLSPWNLGEGGGGEAGGEAGGAR